MIDYFQTIVTLFSDLCKDIAGLGITQVDCIPVMKFIMEELKPMVGDTDPIQEAKVGDLLFNGYQFCDLEDLSDGRDIPLLFCLIMLVTPNIELNECHLEFSYLKYVSTDFS